VASIVLGLAAVNTGNNALMALLGCHRRFTPKGRQWLISSSRTPPASSPPMDS
jgi:hypothetical protein